VTLRLALSEKARVVARVSRRARGVRKGRRCVAPRRRLRHHERCVRLVPVITLRRTVDAGRVKLSIPARVHHRRLRKGRYVITVRATDEAGNASRARASFRVR
jgi:hypothetical protein